MGLCCSRSSDAMKPLLVDSGTNASVPKRTTNAELNKAYMDLDGALDKVTAVELTQVDEHTTRKAQELKSRWMTLPQDERVPELCDSLCESSSVLLSTVISLQRDSLKGFLKLQTRNYHDANDDIGLLTCALICSYAYQEVFDMLEACVRVCELDYGPLYVHSLEALLQLAQVSDRMGTSHSHVTEGLFRTLSERYEQVYGPSDLRVAYTATAIGSALDRQKQHDDALKWHERCVTLRTETLGERHEDVAQALTKLALCQEHRKEFLEAEKLLQRVLRIREALYGMQSNKVAFTLNDMAMLLKAAERYQEAEKYMRQAMEAWRIVYGDEHPFTINASGNVGLILIQKGEGQQGKRLVDQAYRALIALDFKTDHPWVQKFVAASTE